MLGAHNLQHSLPTAVGMPGETGKKALVAAAQLLQHFDGDGVHDDSRELQRLMVAMPTEHLNPRAIIIRIPVLDGSIQG
jgi:hypothetical protein